MCPPSDVATRQMRRMHPLSKRPTLDHDGDGDIDAEELKRFEESTTCGVMESPRFFDISMLFGKALISFFTVLFSKTPVLVAVVTVVQAAEEARAASLADAFKVYCGACRSGFCIMV